MVAAQKRPSTSDAKAEAMRRKWAEPGYRERLSAAHKGHQPSLSARAAMRSAAVRRPPSTISLPPRGPMTLAQCYKYLGIHRPEKVVENNRRLLARYATGLGIITS